MYNINIYIYRCVSGCVVIQSSPTHHLAGARYVSCRCVAAERADHRDPGAREDAHGPHQT